MQLMPDTHTQLQQHEGHTLDVWVAEGLAFVVIEVQHVLLHSNNP
jgi:hypothetical protein